MISTIETLIEDSIKPEHLDVTGDGSHFQVIVVSNQFDGLRAVQRQQKIYALVNQQIADGSIHALTIKTYTAAEWKQASKFSF
jgi:acid stress-induced BolA-like protein IbaG/YrbA